MLGHTTTLVALQGNAEKEAEKLETEAATRAQANYTNWLKEGPGQGIGRQHKMSRVAGGWIPNRTSNEEEEHTTAEDGTDTLHGMSDWEHA